MKKTSISIFATITILTLIISSIAATIILLNNNNTNTSNTTQTPVQSPNTPSSSTSVTTSSDDPSQQHPTFNGVPVYSYKIIQTYPHDSLAFTQGLAFDGDGNLLEGTGLNGNSSLRRVNLVDGRVLQQIGLSFEYFGEGIAVVDNTVIQLTWQNHVGFIYDKASFELLGHFNFDTEGWGLTYDGTFLIMSDGTDVLYFLDTTTFQTVHSINVHDNNGAVKNLNDLEYINGTIYANIWHSSKIAIINPDTGQIEVYIDLEQLAQPYVSKNSESVLNGIAYNPQTNKLYVTGKNWFSLYEIQII